MFELAVKLGALLAFCGGPLVLADALAGPCGDPWSFAVAFTPVALIAMGAFALRDAEHSGAEHSDAEHSGVERLFAWGGLLGVVLLTAIDAWALTHLLARPLVPPHRADLGLIWLGLGVGGLVIARYLLAFRSWHERDRALSAAQAP